MQQGSKFRWALRYSQPRIVTKPALCIRNAASAVAGTSLSDRSSAKPELGDVLQLHCSRLGFDGKGVCLHGPTNFVVLCDRSLPGEQLEARITAVKKGYAEAVKLRTTRQHDHAVQPRCPHFGPCGGCTLQSLDYAAQLAAKEAYVREQVRRVGRVPDVEAVMRPAVGAPEPYHYRNKTTFTFSTTEWVPEAAGEQDAEKAAGSSCSASSTSSTTSPSSSSSGSPSRASSWVLGQLRPGSASQVLPISTCSVQDATADQLLHHARELCQQLRLPAFDAATKTGLLRSLAIRKGSSSSSSSSGEASAPAPAAAAAEYMTIFTTPAAATSGHLPQLTQLAQQLAAHVPQLVSVVLLEAKEPPAGRSLLQVVRQRVLWGREHLTQQLCGLTFRLSPQSFFQVNTRQAEALYTLVRQAAELQPGDVVLDLYCGTGTIGLSLARHCRQVVGYEINAAAVQDAEVNAALNGISNASFVLGDVQQVFQGMLQQQGGSSASSSGSKGGGKGKAGKQGRAGGGKAGSSSPLAALKPDVVVVDPARAGVSASAVAFLRAAQPRRLVYVSCNAATLARDVEALCRGPGPSLRLLSVQPVDMFPHTDHVEVVAVLERQ